MVRRIKHKLTFQQFLIRIRNQRQNKRHRTTIFKLFLASLPKDKTAMMVGIKREEKEEEQKQLIERKKIVMSMKMLDPHGRYTPIDLDKASIEEMTEWYNKHSGYTQIKRFNDHALAVKRCVEVKKAMDEMQKRANDPKGVSKKAINKQTMKENKMKAKGKKAEKKTAKVTTKGKVGAKSSIRDMKIVKVAKENPRREGTEGYKSWEKIKSGMTYLQAIDAGARNVDIRCDVSKGNLKLVKA